MMPFNILSEDSHLCLFIGGLGAGKTDIIINLAIWKATKLKKAQKVYLIDLDIVNPFFRIRKLQTELEEKGLTVISPEPRIKNGDLPALPAAVWGLISDPSTTVFCDVGGGELGVRPLARLKDMAINKNIYVFAVINPYRPGFQTVELINSSISKIQEVSGLKITHIIANPNLLHETTIDVFNTGLNKIVEFSNMSEIPIAFAVVTDGLFSEMKQYKLVQDKTNFQNFAKYENSNIYIFSITRFWQIPWHIGLTNSFSSKVNLGL